MRSGGVEDEGVSGFDFMRLIRQCDAAVALRYELEGEKGKFLPVHDEIRGAPFAATAYEAQSGGIALTVLPFGEEEASGADDLL